MAADTTSWSIFWATQNSGNWLVNRRRAAHINTQERNIAISEHRGQPKVFITQLGELAKRKSLVLFEDFRKHGIAARASFGRDSIKSQLRIAHRLGIKYTLIIGQKEALEGTVILREIISGVQETIPMEKILDVVKQHLKS